MDCNSYWLIVVDNDQVTVSAVISDGQKFNVASIGPSIDWDIDNPTTIAEATDKSLSQAAQSASLPEENEPESAAFILPSFWVGIDGKIIGTKQSIIETLCRSLKFKPLGFISCDDAFVENVNSNENFPSSFIFVDLKKTRLDLSLVLMGKIKERVTEHYNGDFNPASIEDSLRQLETDNSLPPLMYIIGAIDQTIIKKIQDYPWIGKKALDIFFHLPEINFVNTSEMVTIYANFVNNQLISEPNNNIPSPVVIEQPAVIKENLNVVEPEDLGFGQITNHIETPTASPEPCEPPKVKKIKQFPKIKLPHFNFHLKFNFKFLWLVAVLPIFVLLLLLVNHSSVTLFITPYPINVSKPLTLDSNITTFDATSGNIPVIKQSFDLKVTASVPTTGKKIVGEKAKGSIIIFNKLDKTQNLAKGDILIDSSGKQYELITPVQVPGSSYDLTQGIIKLGQTKTVVSATDIGPEGNIAKDSQLTFKTSADNYIAKAETDFVGGTKQEINIVSKQDKVSLEAQLKEAIKVSIEEKIKNDITNLSGAIIDTAQQKQKRIDYLRDINEQTDTLSGNLEATVQVFVIDSKQKDEIISSIVKQDPQYANFSLEPEYTLQFNIDEITDDNSKGTLSIAGEMLPVINTNAVKAKIAGKFEKNARKYLDSSIDKIYNVTVKSSLGPLGKILPISILTNSIDLSVKSK